MKNETIKPSDQELIEGISRGDDSILNYIVKNIFPEVQTFLRMKGANQEECKDICLQALESIYFAQDKQTLVLSRASFMTYFKKVCFYQWTKWQRRDRIHERAMADSEIISPEELKSFAEIEVEKKRFAIYEEALLSLDERCRQLIVWAFQQLWTNEQIAEKLNISNATVRKRKYDCKAKLIGMIKVHPVYKELIA